MSSPTHSLLIAAAAPVTTLLVEQPKAWPDAPQEAISVPRCPSCDIAINTRHSHCEDFQTTGYDFLCRPAPVRTFPSGAEGKIGIGRRGVALLAFPNKPQCGIDCLDFDGFPWLEV